MSFTCFIATAQNIRDIKIQELIYKKIDEAVLVEAQILTGGVALSPNEMLIITPMLHSNVTRDSLELAPIVVLGKTRDKIVKRGTRLDNKTYFPANAAYVLIYNKQSSQDIHYSEAVKYHNWMKNARLIIKAEKRGCAHCYHNLGDQVLADRILKIYYQPTYKLTYIVPEAEPVKARADRYTASFNYHVARHELLRDFQNNAAEFEQVDSVINDIKSSPDLEITEFTVSGYASPEGNYEKNRALSDRRANSFANYLSSAHGIPRGVFKVTGYGEDWDGLVEAIKNSTLEDKDEVLRIIAEEPNHDARDAKFKKLSNGATWQALLKTYYPPLRRTDYIIAYHVRAFSVEEAKEMLKTNPKLLSLNEMFLVAQTYNAGSPEFKEVFDIASLLFPEEPIAIMNNATANLESGNVVEAIESLNKIVDDSRVWNNLGVAYAREGNIDLAKLYLEKAAELGETEAAHNLKELNKVIEDRK